MHVLIWMILGCESRPQPGSPVVFVDADKSYKSLSEESVQEEDSQKEDSQKEDSTENNNSDEDPFSDRSFEISSDEMANNKDSVPDDSKQNISDLTVNQGTKTDPVEQGETVGDPKSEDESGGGELLDSIKMPFVLVDLLETVPPRAVLRLPSGDEIVAKAGMLIPKYNVLVLAVGTESATLVKVFEDGDTSRMEPLYLTPLY